ncbi:MAG: RNA chaperone Hfq [Oscillospiraceae bacterium]
MKTMNLQDIFLNTARIQKIPVTIFLTSGFQFKGLVTGFDAFIVALDCEGKQTLVYKHAISTVVSSRPILMAENCNDDGVGD